MSRAIPMRVPLLLFSLYLLGLALALLSFVDLQWGHWWLVPQIEQPGPAIKDATPTVHGGAGGASGQNPSVAQVTQSIVHVRAVQCGDSGELVGTGFVVKAGYVATAAHVLGDAQSCGGKVTLVDAKGREHSAALEGASEADDLALLRISDTTLPPLQLADSTAYEVAGQWVPLVTIGYPLEQRGLSSPDSAAISSEGTLSHFDRAHNVFVTSGLNFNPGNSGGPVFIRTNWQVLGVVRAKLAQGVGEGAGFVAPSRTVSTFFREKTGQDLR